VRQYLWVKDVRFRLWLRKSLIFVVFEILFPLRNIDHPRTNRRAHQIFFAYLFDKITISLINRFMFDIMHILKIKK
jgi:hypothetical protein